MIEQFAQYGALGIGWIVAGVLWKDLRDKQKRDEKIIATDVKTRLQLASRLKELTTAVEELTAE